MVFRIVHYKQKMRMAVSGVGQELLSRAPNTPVHLRASPEPGIVVMKGSSERRVA